MRKEEDRCGGRGGDGGRGGLVREGERERERKGVEKLEGEKKLKEGREGDGRNSELRMNRVNTRRKTAEEGFREH